MDIRTHSSLDITQSPFDVLFTVYFVLLPLSSSSAEVGTPK